MSNTTVDSWHPEALRRMQTLGVTFVKADVERNGKCGGCIGKHPKSAKCMELPCCEIASGSYIFVEGRIHE